MSALGIQRRFPSRRKFDVRFLWAVDGQPFRNPGKTDALFSDFGLQTRSVGLPEGYPTGARGAVGVAKAPFQVGLLARGDISGSDSEPGRAVGGVAKRYDSSRNLSLPPWLTTPSHVFLELRADKTLPIFAQPPSLTTYKYCWSSLPLNFQV
jgi:hypothetical protein